MRAIIVYDSWYGDTRAAAEEIGRGLASVTGDDPAVVEVAQAGPRSVHQFDLIVLGTPTHFGRATRKMREFVKELAELGPVEGRFATFDTCFEADAGKAAREIATLARSASGASPGPTPQLSVVVEATRGPVRAGELARARAFGAELGRSGSPRLAVPA